MMSNNINTMKIYNGFGVKIGTMEYDEYEDKYYVIYEIPEYDYYEGTNDDENF